MFHGTLCFFNATLALKTHELVATSAAARCCGDFALRHHNEASSIFYPICAVFCSDGRPSSVLPPVTLIMKPAPFFLSPSRFGFRLIILLELSAKDLGRV